MRDQASGPVIGHHAWRTLRALCTGWALWPHQAGKPLLLRASKPKGHRDLVGRYTLRALRACRAGGANWASGALGASCTLRASRALGACITSRAGWALWALRACWACRALGASWARVTLQPLRALRAHGADRTLRACGPLITCWACGASWARITLRALGACRALRPWQPCTTITATASQRSGQQIPGPRYAGLLADACLNAHPRGACMRHHIAGPVADARLPSPAPLQRAPGLGQGSNGNRVSCV